MEQAVREADIICSHPCKLTFDLLTLKVASESRMTWTTSVPILVFLGLSVLVLFCSVINPLFVQRMRLPTALNNHPIKLLYPVIAYTVTQFV